MYRRDLEAVLRETPASGFLDHGDTIARIAAIRGWITAKSTLSSATAVLVYVD